jgi:hypothetical protein
MIDELLISYTAIGNMIGQSASSLREQRFPARRISLGWLV